MASLFRKKRSPFYWIKFKDPITGKLEYKSTGYLLNTERKLAKQHEAEKNLEECRVVRTSAAHQWSTWVPSYLEATYTESPGTLTRMLGGWRLLAAYLSQQGVATPQQVTRQCCLDYVAWRRKRGRANGTKKKPLNINTIILDLKVLGSVVQEAVRRGWLQSNPCWRLGIKRAAPKEKHEMNDDQIAFVRAEIQRKRDRAATLDVGPEEKRNAHYFHVSWEIAMAQGCRLAETYMPLSNINLQTMEIAFLAKGRKNYTAPLNPNLVPLVKELLRSRRKYTYDRPKMYTLKWHKFFDDMRTKRPDLNLDQVSFHSSRVTVVSRVERSGVAESVCMKYVHHASTTVHRVYRKVTQHELGPVLKALESLSAPGSSSSSRSSQSPGEPPSSPAQPEELNGDRD